MNFGELIAKGSALFARKGADALADTLETAPPADLVRIQASVSGYKAMPAWVVGHRGSPATDPDAVMSAYIRAGDAGLLNFDGDYRPISGGGGVMSHDGTPTVMTGGAATAAWTTYTADQVSALTVPSNTIMQGTGYKTERFILFDDFVWLARKYPNTKMWVEAKRALPAETDGLPSMKSLVAQLNMHGVDKSRWILQSFDATACVYAKNAGYTTLYLTQSELNQTAINAAVACGATYVGYGVGGIIAQSVTDAAHAAGLKVCAYTVNRRNICAQLLARGVDYIWVDDPIYAAGTLRSNTFSGAEGRYPFGIFPMDAIHTYKTAARMVPTTGGMAITPAEVYTKSSLIGELAPTAGAVMPASYTISGVAVMTAQNSADRLFSIVFGSPDDQPYLDASGPESGYVAIVRPTFPGTAIYRKDANAAPTALVFGNGTATTLGADVPFNISVTPTHVSLTALGTTVTVADSVIRGGGYTHFCANGASAVLKSLYVSY